MRRSLWLVVAAAVLLSTVAYAATYSASVSTYNVSGTYNIQQKAAALAFIPTYSVSYLGSYIQKQAALGIVNFCVLGNYSYVLYEPNNEWHDCDYPYRLPVLVEVSDPQSDVYVVFNISDSGFLGNLSSGREVKIFLDSAATPLNFCITEKTDAYIIYNVYFESLQDGFHYVYFYYGKSIELAEQNLSYTLYTPSDIRYGSTQSAPASCYVITPSTTTTSDFYSWHAGGGGAPLPPSSSDESGNELVTRTSTEVPMLFHEVVTKVKEVSNWLVSRSGRSALLLFGLLVVLGLVLLSSGGRKGKRRVRGGGRRRR